MQRLILLLTILFATALLQHAQAGNQSTRVKYKGSPSYIYRIYLTDKQGSPFTLSRPSRYLSRRSMERRRRQNLPIDSTDLPVNPHYIEQLRKYGVQIIGQSRWQNTLLVIRTHSQQTALRTLQPIGMAGSRLDITDNSPAEIS